MKLIAYLSYSMHLYHILVLNLTNNVFRGAVSGLGGVLLHALIAGGLSYLLIEHYFLQLKHRLKHSSSALKGQPA